MGKVTSKGKRKGKASGTSEWQPDPSTPVEVERGRVRQEGPMGCGVACVASRLRISYPQALKRFESAGVPGSDQTTGFTRTAMLDVLKQAGHAYEFHSFGATSQPARHRRAAELPPGSIVYVQNESKYRWGHYLLRMADGWHDPLERTLAQKLPACPRSFLQPPQ